MAALSAAAQEVLDAVAADTKGTHRNSKTEHKAWKHEFVTLGMPSWAYTIAVGDVCPLFNLDACNGTACDGLLHQCLLCKDSSHQAFEQVHELDGDATYVCPVIRSLDDYGMDVLEEEENLKK